MSTPGLITQLSLGRTRAKLDRALTSEPVVGKDVLELLTSAMYLDPRAIYREYVQNSADAFDDAFATGLFDERDLGRVDVTLDRDARSVRIKDNGVGLPVAEAERVLTSFGASPKRGTQARGFRGVGRLAGLAYAQSVSFKTKAPGETASTLVTWDCRKLRAALTDSIRRDDLSQTVRDIVGVTIEEESDSSSHYFEVLLERVVRTKHDVLLNSDEVARYLGEVSPAPFHQDFRFAERIEERLRPHVPPPRFRIFLNGSSEPITRPHRTEFAVSDTKTDVASAVQIIEIPDGDGGTRALGWIVHHGYLGAIHGACDVRGLRARVGDVQVGTGDVFADVFPEARFNAWAIGEVHVLDRRVIPNGRRDNFELNGAYSDLLGHIASIARDITRRCRQSSGRRHRLRAFAVRDERVKGILDILKSRRIARSRELRMQREVLALLERMRRLAESSLPDADQLRLRRRLRTLQARYEAVRSLPRTRGRPVPIGSSRRAAYEEIIDLIYEYASNVKAANALVNRITARLAAEHYGFRSLNQQLRQDASHSSHST